jgi:HSP20 family molecular chaperone IbpA
LTIVSYQRPQIQTTTIPLIVSAATNSNDNDPAYQQARQDYRAYLAQLKDLSSQYKRITGEVKKVIQEEGVPVWDDNGMGGIKMADVTVQELDSQSFGDTDIQDNDKYLTVKIDIPGVKKDELRVSILENAILRVSGRREEETSNNFASSSARFIRTERRHGDFERQIKLPVPVSNTGTEAKYENGVLTIKVLKASVNAKEIPVQIR